LGRKYSWGREVQLKINFTEFSASRKNCFGVLQTFRKKYEKKSQESM
jgi:hypothetical protein